MSEPNYQQIRKNNIRVVVIVQDRFHSCHGCSRPLKVGAWAVLIGTDPDDIGTLLCSSCINYLKHTLYVSKEKAEKF